MNRRHTLKAAVAGAAAAIAAPALANAAGNPDAKLIAFCDRFTALEHEKRRIYATAADTVEADRAANAATAPIFEEQGHILDRVHEMEAVTWDGLRARLRMAFAFQPKCVEAPVDWDDMLAGAIIDDLNRLLGAEPAAVQS
ncbi:hypothetical protein [Acidiphilium sp.]|uniref:hypothetical protein n=1 Tax=Acidiphilium sp. TaxID=527 RepID=UPI0025850963|nr:hypothetical protein [Acidiphilium sp.]